jgi:NADH-quinone oxidoreductase subunit C
MDDVHKAALRLQEVFPGAVEDVSAFRGETTVVIRKENLLEVGRFLKEEADLGFDFLSFLCAVDHHPGEPRFEMVYQLYSTQYHHRLRLKVRLPSEDPAVESVTVLWPTADWHEREAFDLMGIRIRNHPDLRRILLPEGWEGHPLRKDYPLKGPDRSPEGEEQGDGRAAH